jgi:hypothetical protein
MITKRTLTTKISISLNTLKMKKIALIIFILLITGCGIYKPVDTRKVPVNATERAQKNIQEGRGFRLSNFGKNRSVGSFEFASSNEMWRASIDLLDFAPFSNVDYSGGIIITDWFSDEDKNNEFIKITVKFLSNEIRADGLEVIIHNKKCSNQNQNECKVSKVESNISQEIKLAILQEAAKIKEKERIVDEDYTYPDLDNKAK